MTQSPQNNTPQSVADAPPVAETVAEFAKRAEITADIRKVRGPITCRTCRVPSFNRTVCPDCRGSSTRAPRKGDDWTLGANEWRYSVARFGVRDTVDGPFFTGVGIKSPPTVADILNALRSDAECASGTFRDFCDDLGYDEDSRKALAIYHECQKIADNLRRLLGHEFYAALMATERL